MLPVRKSTGTHRGKSPIIGTFPNMGRCTISYQEVQHSLLKNVNHEVDEAILTNRSINGHFGTEWATLSWCALKFLLIAKL